MRVCLPACLPARPHYWPTDLLTDHAVESKDEGPGVEEVEAAVVALIGQVEGGRVRAGYSLLIQSSSGSVGGKAGQIY